MLNPLRIVLLGSHAGCNAVRAHCEECYRDVELDLSALIERYGTRNASIFLTPLADQLNKV